LPKTIVFGEEFSSSESLLVKDTMAKLVLDLKEKFKLSVEIKPLQVSDEMQAPKIQPLKLHP
jgi:hypothetical protein